MSRLTRDGTAEPISRDQIFRHARGQGILIFPVQLTTSRIGNLTRLIHTLLNVMTVHTYIMSVVPSCLYCNHSDGQGESFFPSIFFVPLPFPLCVGEYLSYVVCFPSGWCFEYLVITVWIFDHINECTVV